MEWVNAVVQGILVGGLYAMFAAGLSLIFGVMRLVNIAHGDFIVAAAYLAMVIIQGTGLHPLLSLLIVVPVAAVFGYGLQRGIFNRTLGKDILPPLLVSFGLSVILQNGMLELFTADSRKLDAGPQYLFYRTALGRAFRATSDDTEIAEIMGLDNRKVYAWAMALCMGVVAVAGVFLAIRSNFDPFMGPGRLIFGFESVIIGGLGNLWGTLVGGVILGVAQGLGAEINPGWQLLAGHIAFLVVLAVKPHGLFPRNDG